MVVALVAYSSRPAFIYPLARLRSLSVPVARWHRMGTLPALTAFTASVVAHANLTKLASPAAPVVLPVQLLALVGAQHPVKVMLGGRRQVRQARVRVVEERVELGRASLLGPSVATVGQEQRRALLAPLPQEHILLALTLSVAAAAAAVLSLVALAAQTRGTYRRRNPRCL